MDAAVLRAAGDEELTDTLEQLFGLMNATQALAFEVIRELAGREVYVVDGCRTMGNWLSARLGLSQSTARQWSDVAARLESLPNLSALFSSGSVSFDKIAPAARSTTPEKDAEVAEALPSMSAAGAAALERRTVEVPPEDEAEAQRRRHLRFRHRGQELQLSGSLPGLEGETVLVTLRRIAEGFGPDPETGIYESPEARLADALVELAGGRLAADADPDRATVVVMVDSDVLGGSPGPAESGEGHAFTAETARRAACDARLQHLIRDVQTGSIDLGRTTRTISPGLSRYLRYRDGGCRFPGCPTRFGLQAHHIEHWANGGRTDRSNLVTLRRCHRRCHEENWKVEGDAEGELTFTSSAGTVLRSRPMPLRSEVRERFLGQLDLDIGLGPGPRDFDLGRHPEPGPGPEPDAAQASCPELDLVGVGSPAGGATGDRPDRRGPPGWP